MGSANKQMLLKSVFVHVAAEDDVSLYLYYRVTLVSTIIISCFLTLSAIGLQGTYYTYIHSRRYMI